MRSITVGKNDAGQRLDRFLSKSFPLLKHGVIRKALRNKDIKVNRKRTDAEYFLIENDVIDVYIKDELLTGKTISDKATSGIALEQSDIIYEDENILLINKPVGLVVHEDNQKTDDTLIKRIINYLIKTGEYDSKHELSFTPSLCNRLDRNTSGIVIAAKNAEALRIMSQKLRDREIEKLYLCLVYGVMPKKHDILTHYLEKSEKENRVYINDKKTAKNLTIKTEYKVLKEADDYSLLEINLLTGRTHQIRAHLSYIGHPILGDSKYGDNKINRLYKYKSQALCSYKLKFIFSTDAGILEYLKNKEFEINKDW